MNSENGGPSPSARQRQAAAEIARKKVLAAYSSYQPKNEQTAAATNAANAQKTVAQPSTDWKRYHSAWQNYYQKYYSDYYSKAAREFVAGERQKLAQEKAALAAEERRRAEAAAKQAETIAKKQAAEAARLAAVASAAQSTPPDTFRTPVTKQQSAGVYSETPAAPVTAKLPAPDAEVEKNIFIRRLKARATKRASLSEAVKNRRRRLAPLLAGIAVVLFILFLQYNRLIFAPIAAYVSPGDAPSTEISALDPTITSSVSADPKLIIPSLNIEVPVAFGIPLSEVNSAMNNGVAQFRIQGASALPGEIGNLVVTGHSAGDIYSNNQYKFIFSGLERLKNGDLIYINYNSTRYTYQMVDSSTVEPTDIAALTGDTDKPRLILVTCTPLGTSRYRLLIYADQISPSYKDAEIAEDPATESTDDMPQNEPTFFENIWNWLTGGN